MSNYSEEDESDENEAQDKETHLFSKEKVCAASFLFFHIYIEVQYYSCQSQLYNICQNEEGSRELLLGDAPRPPMFPPIFLRHLCIFLLIVASPRRSALAAPIPESDDHVT